MKMKKKRAHFDPLASTPPFFLLHCFSPPFFFVLKFQLTRLNTDIFLRIQNGD